MKTNTLALHRFLFLARGLTFIVFLLTGFLFSQPAQALASGDQSARAAALQWLGLIDSGHYRQAFEEWPPRLKAASNGVDYFIKWMQTRRRPLGRTRTRAFYKLSAYHNANGWPDGNYQQIDFKSSFEHKGLGLERVIMTKETGQWQVGNYFFR